MKVYLVTFTAALIIHGAGFFAFSRPPVQVPFQSGMSSVRLTLMSNHLPLKDKELGHYEDIQKHAVPAYAAMDDMSEYVRILEQAVEPLDVKTLTDPADRTEFLHEIPLTLGDMAVKGVRSDVSVAGTVRPVYPRMSRILGEEGRVVVNVLVSPSGRALSCSIVESSGSSRLNAAAAKAVMAAAYRPAECFGIPVTDERTFAFIFTLHE